jgi:hypothetical protein
MDEPQTSGPQPAAQAAVSAVAPLVPGPVWEAVVGMVSGAGMDPDAQRAALVHVAGLAVRLGLSVTLPLPDPGVGG